MSQTTTPAVTPLQRYFTNGSHHPYEDVIWETRDAVITNADGTEAFRQDGVVFPVSWSQTATNVVASKYFRGQAGAAQRETSVKQMITRVVETIARWGYNDGYFDAEQAEDVVFADELTHILLHQMATFASPCWFNIGVQDVPQQASSCFIISVQDSMESILEWYRQEAMIFKGGSGSGINISAIRSKQEHMSGGGKPSGPLSFMKAADASAGVIKSGGKTRRAAKMVIMDVDHPDIEDFIWAKVHEERKARALIAAGYDDAIDGEAYSTVAFQNANHSVSVTDTFLRAVQENGMYETFYRTNFNMTFLKHAKEIFHQIAEATWHCGDPGAFFYDTINAWHTTPSRGPIINPNPCSEFLRPPDEACNLSSINLLKFLRDDNSFDVDAFRHVVNVMITAMEILVGRASYPTPAIEKNSHDYRTLGLGYTNLGALLMAKGLPYDSDAGRDYAASMTALMTGQAYARSAELAAIQGPFVGYEANKDAMLGVIEKHRMAIPDYCHDEYCKDEPLWHTADLAWHNARALGDMHGYRNAQVSLLAPTGTISFMMDCQTTGIEPDIALVNYKKLVGGGTVKHVNTIVPRALRTRGYTEELVHAISGYVDRHGTIDGCKDIKQRDLPVFDCAFSSSTHGRSIHYEGHIRMVSAVQPFLSGGVSKTINLPQIATVEDIEAAYMLGWKLGCKSLAIYRDGCKATQVLTTHTDRRQSSIAVPKNTDDPDTVMSNFMAWFSANPASWHTFVEKLSTVSQGMITKKPQRRRLPDERPALTHKGNIAGHEFYVTIGLYDTGEPGEMFLTMAKEGSTISGLMDAFATSVSLSLQYGVPLTAMVEKFSHMRFEPAGFTHNKDIPIAKSVMDYIFKWLALKFFPADGMHASPSMESVILDEGRAEVTSDDMMRHTNGHTSMAYDDAPSCAECGGMMMRSGSCYACQGCGYSSGCS